MNARVYGIAIGLLLFCAEARTQDQHKLDSLRKSIPLLRGEARYNACEELSYELLSKYDSTAMYYVDEMARTAAELGDSLKIVYAGRRKAIGWRRFDHIDSSLYYGKYAMAIAERNKFTEEQMKLLNGFGITYTYIAEYDLALESYERSLRLARELKDSLTIGNAYGNIGLMYYKMDKCPLAIVNFKESIAVKLNSKDSTDLDRVYINMGLSYQKIDVDTAEMYIRKGQSLFREGMDIMLRSEALIGLAIVEHRRKHYKEALQYFNQSYAIAEQASSYRFQIENLTCMGELYLDQGAYEKMYRVLERAKQMSERYGYRERELDIEHLYIRLYEALGDYKSLTRTRTHCITLEQEIYSGKLSERIGRYQMDFEMNKRKTLIASQREVMAAKDKSIEYGYYILAALIIAGILFILFVILLYRQYQNKRKVGRILQERVAARIGLLQTQEARVAMEYDALRKAIHDRNETIRSGLIRLATPDQQPVTHVPTEEYVEKIKQEASRCLLLLK